MSSIEDRLLKSPIPKEAPELAGFFTSPKLKFFPTDKKELDYAYSVVCLDFGLEIAKTLYGNAPYINDISEPSSCQCAYKAILTEAGVDLAHVHSITMRLFQQVTAIELVVEYKGWVGGDTIILPLKNPDKYANMLESEMEAHRAKAEGTIKQWGCGYAERPRVGENFRKITSNILQVILFKGENDTRTDPDDDN